jgi:hypothetical protein
MHLFKTTNLFPLVHLLLDSLENENGQDNIQMVNDDDETMKYFKTIFNIKILVSNFKCKL